MGWSIQEVQSRHAIINDEDILALIATFTAMINRKLVHSEGLGTLMSTWTSAVELAGPGTIDLELGQVSDSPAQLQTFHRLLSETQSVLDTFGDRVPRELLNEGPFGNTATFAKDYPVSRLTDTIRQLRELTSQPAGT